MSGIAGIWHFDGTPAASTLAQMMKALRHRGEDGSGQWHSAHIGLGHQCLSTKHRATQAALPLVSEPFVITADARLDNRVELGNQLGLDSLALSDEALVVASYQKWGDQCPHYLTGDFAFAIYNLEQQQLFAARDPLGVKPFYYALAPHLFAFASELGALLDQVSYSLNEVQIGNYLLAGTVDERHETFFQPIVRLPAGHALMVQAGRATLQPYWNFSADRELYFASDQEYVEQFRRLLWDAVECRLETEHPVGAALSGGLDSSSIACLARMRVDSLHTFHLASEVPACDERSMVDVVLAQGGFQHHERPNPGILTNLEQVMSQVHSPLYTLNYPAAMTTHQMAHEAGVRVLLDGIDGDSMLSLGWSYLAELSRKGDWTTLQTEIATLSNRYGFSQHAYLERHVMPSVAQLAVQGQWAAFLKLSDQLHQHFAMPYPRLLWRWGILPFGANLKQQVLKTTWREANPALKPTFAKRIDLDHRWQVINEQTKQVPVTAREAHYRALTHGGVQTMLEEYDHAAARFGVEPRHPFTDRRLVEFALALPGRFKFGAGLNRLILRQAVQGILPDTLRLRGQKTVFSPHILHHMRTTDKGLVERVLQAPPQAIQHYLDVAVLRHVYAHFQQTPSLADALLLSRAVKLALWLEAWAS
jgi:asparagine synthase (glutamine-hydrolysing)